MRAAALGDMSDDGGAVGVCDDGDLHCTQPGAAAGSLTVFAGGLPVHREGDPRGCLAITLVSPLRTVWVN